MIETGLYTYLVAELDPSLEISWGKIDAKFDFESGVTSVNFFKLPSQSARTTPSYLDSFQVSVRNKYIDAAQQTANDIIELFHLYHGKIGDYLVTVDDIFSSGVIYEEEDIVHIPLTLNLKYTGI